MFLFVMTSVRLCCLIAPWSRRLLLYWATNTTARYSECNFSGHSHVKNGQIHRLSCHRDHWERKHITGNILNRYMSTWGIVLILFAVSSYPAHQLPKNTASFVILCGFIISLCTRYAVLLSFQPLKLIFRNPCDHSIPYPFHFLPIFCLLCF